MILVIASVFLFAFVYSEGVNQGVDWANAKFSEKAKLTLPHMPDKPFQLGLDLLGGTHLVYEADLSKVESADRADAMEGIRDVIERRVNFFGVSEPVVQVSADDRIIIELAGISDVNQAISMIGETPFIEFKEEAPDAQRLVEEFQAKQAAGQTDVLAEIELQDKLFLSTGLNGRHLKRAQLVFDQQTGVAQVSLLLNEEGAVLFGEITKKNLGKRVAIFLDGFPISTPVVQSEITSGEAVISGNFSPQEAKLLATRLNSGALPVPIHLISQQTIGASLGAESVSASLKAGLYGLVFVAIFMIILYRLPGAVSILALLVYTLIVLTVYKLMPVTLTLAGIAGFILTLGMAVDANVLIFARMKEELALGKSVAFSVNEGFRRAWLSIRDSHVTTLLSAFVLYSFTTSIVRGFALTLGIGAIISLFTATIITRALLLSFIGKWSEKYKWIFG
ncbi:MAG: protein-export membrane protein SecD [Candidatus Yanofskybacteria bacterium RIFCSPHIGHO2_02_FULL_41_29]|uniref:Protein translocase subunit SecD n=1 Tax=Candidatus Yanofskybacteria bacterium RIFCSPHIGHO2_01_FULL_41_53 TaxID=1802663 RepID=A0A1F8EF91_9BACT|nr:MAG: protein-export membrane protein SecD [Candidatus Yanofskybacteria bacterium RIFCSPHIGHO2_01_FULL_41_53]OGN10517.1 MAG: protein-export membrane protein SecD [Candidatus Yanofskybacteria bacterium RIFCSPHIGHO2_02_FULL_41_29]OGN18913.1 MAG: protein-export membrane protein SecD [Candidatus Yanofskybacteria bacterium RIFCSPHIGHO2_12_FULL_41_9]OGN21504.1 MAG: protein-export membrane protein SecD [Candidatus Yanofskybacteria bacterium RIFCSPLOWO2_01_FULL_41_67]OGN28478.1 MAG: protein-export me